MTVTSTRPLAFAHYRWLLTGTTVNTLGNSIAPVAIAFAVLDVGGSTTQLGLVVAAYALADIAAVLGGGVLGDRLPRQLMMRGANTAAGVVQLGLAASLLTGVASVWLIAVAGALNGALGSLAGPSAQAITPQTVPAGVLRQAITLRRLAQNAASIAGFGLAGVVVAWIGSGGAVLVDAVTFLVAATCFTRISVQAVAAPAERRHPFAEAAEGLREVLRRSWLWAGIAMALVYHLFYGGAQGVLGPVVVGEGISRPAWGYALSAMMVGFVSGGLLSLVWKPRRILLVGELFLMLTVCFPLAMAWSTSLWLVLAGAFLHGFGLEIFSVGWDLAIQENVPEHLLARVYSFDQLGSFLARPVGLALTGPLAAAVGARRWLVVVGLAMLVAEAVPFAVPEVRRLERRPLPDDVRVA
ncbi:MAG TPA: MFS transporter [Angustibacter sp.]|nr:MFS transporter [Angustibacter sp.]